MFVRINMIMISSVFPIVFAVLFSAVLTVLWYLQPPITESTIIAFIPWIAVAASLSVLSQRPPMLVALAPLFRSPGVYLLTFVLAGSVWIIVVTNTFETSSWTVPQILGVSGLLFAASVVGMMLGLRGISHLFWPVASVVITAVLTAAVWFVFETSSSQVTAETGILGQLVIFSQLLDGVTTIIGVDLLGLVEQTPLSRTVLEVAARLPTAELLGVGWVFTLLKLLLAVLAIRLVYVYFSDDPEWRSLLLGIAATTGLGPGFHNLLLYVTFS